MKKDIIYKLLKSESVEDVRLGMEYACNYLTNSELFKLNTERYSDWGDIPIKPIRLYFHVNKEALLFFNGCSTFIFYHESYHHILHNSEYTNIDPENTRFKNENLQI